MYCLGIDTSCYTTSVAVVNEDFELCFDSRIILDVPEGGRGLRQSDAFFQHVRNIDLLVSQCMDVVPTKNIKGISVSTKPRNAIDSYMPVFLAGMHSAKTIGSILKLPVIEVSHQDSHIQAGLWSCRHDMGKDFMAYHVSGGTTEFLKVCGDEVFSITEIGGTSDLNAGQFIDRIGVAMGIKFPCGQEMDRLCNEFEIEGINIPISIDGCRMSFSGPETHVQRLVRGRVPDRREAAEISKGIFLCIARSIEKTVLNAKHEYGSEKLLLVGGVVSNTIIKEYLTKKSVLSKNGVKSFFADAAYSPDNAVGTAVLGMKSISANRR